MWAKCDNCDEYGCTDHEVHVHECTCPPVEVWYEYNVDPYSDGVKELEEAMNSNNETMTVEADHWVIRNLESGEILMRVE